MDIQAARAFYAANSADERYVHDASGLAQVSDLFKAADAAGRDQIWDVFAAFALEGDRLDTIMAANFFANNPPPERVYATLVAAVLAGTHLNAAALERIVGDPRARLADADRQALTALFVADPGAHFTLSPTLVKHAPSGPTWDAYIAALKTMTDPALLAYGLEGACYAMREDDYFAAFIGRDAALIDAVAERLPSGEGDRLQAAVRAP